MNLNEYAPFFWTAISNGWTAHSSRTYLKQFGIGVVEWRLLATLSSLGEATSLEAAKLSAVDPGAANRSMKELVQKQLVTPVTGRFPGRSKPFQMTEEGRELALRINKLAKERLELLLQDLSEQERHQFLVSLQKIHARLPELAAD